MEVSGEFFVSDAGRYGSGAGGCDFVCTCLICYARLAIGGPFLLGDTTVAVPMENGQVQVNGQLALSASPLIDDRGRAEHLKIRRSGHLLGLFLC